MQSRGDLTPYYILIINLVGDRILLMQKINYTISTPFFLKGELN